VLQRPLIIDTGPFRVRVNAADSQLFDTLSYFYRDSLGGNDGGVFDYDIRMYRPRSLRRWVRPQILFAIDGLVPFDPHPAENAYPLFEWGLNWCIATSVHVYLMLHAGVVAFGDQALIMPGMPGSGKSTLTAALHLRGGRLMSDEFGLIRPEHGHLLAMPRSIPLKNRSIEAILDFEPAAPLGPTYPRTRKGRVRHVRPGRESQRSQSTPAMPRWLVFPRYDADASQRLVPLDKSDAFRQLAFNAFNYKLLGETAFRAVDALIQRVDCYSLTFNHLDEAVPALQQLVGADHDDGGQAGEGQ
jgi:HprK-related kinase A